MLRQIAVALLLPSLLCVAVNVANEENGAVQAALQEMAACEDKAWTDLHGTMMRCQRRSLDGSAKPYASRLQRLLAPSGPSGTGRCGMATRVVQLNCHLHGLQSTACVQSKIAAASECPSNNIEVEGGANGGEAGLHNARLKDSTDPHENAVSGAQEKVITTKIKQVVVESINASPNLGEGMRKGSLDDSMKQISKEVDADVKDVSATGTTVSPSLMKTITRVVEQEVSRQCPTKDGAQSSRSAITTKGRPRDREHYIPLCPLSVKNHNAVKEVAAKNNFVLAPGSMSLYFPALKKTTNSATGEPRISYASTNIYSLSSKGGEEQGGEVDIPMQTKFHNATGPNGKCKKQGCGFHPANQTCSCWGDGSAYYDRSSDQRRVDFFGVHQTRLVPGWNTQGYNDVMFGDRVSRDLTAIFRVLAGPVRRAAAVFMCPSENTQRVKPTGREETCCHKMSNIKDACYQKAYGCSVIKDKDKLFPAKDWNWVPDKFSKCVAFQDRRKPWRKAQLTSSKHCKKGGKERDAELGAGEEKKSCSGHQTPESCLSDSGCTVWCTRNKLAKCLKRKGYFDRGCVKTVEEAGSTNQCAKHSTPEKCFGDTACTGWCSGNVGPKCQKKKGIFDKGCVKTLAEAKARRQRSIIGRVKTAITAKSTRLIHKFVHKLIPASYQALFMPIVDILMGKEKMANKLKEAGASFSDAFDGTSDRSLAAEAFTTDMRDYMWMSTGKWNPCDWDCLCSTLLDPLLDKRYKMLVRFPRIEDSTGRRFSVKVSNMSEWTAMSLSEKFKYARVSPDSLGLKPEVSPLWYLIRDSMKSVSGNLTSQEYGTKIDQFFDEYTDHPADENFVQAKAKGILCTRKPGGGCVLGTLSQYWIWSLVPVESEKEITCSMFFSTRMDICNTCCCPHGMARVAISSSLVQNSPTFKCAQWFVFCDTLARSLVAGMRAAYVTARLSTSLGCM